MAAAVPVPGQAAGLWPQLASTAHLARSLARSQGTW